MSALDKSADPSPESRQRADGGPPNRGAAEAAVAPRFGRNRTPMVRAIVGVIAVIPDTAEARQALRDTIEAALLAKGVALQGLVSRYEDPQTGIARPTSAPVPSETGVANAQE